MPSFRQLVTSVAQTWRERRDDVRRGRAADRHRARRAASAGPLPDAAPPGPADLDAAVRHLSPPSTAPTAASAAHRSSRRRWCSSSCCGTTPAPVTPTRCALVEATCEAMARGGMYDQLAGWLRPLRRRRTRGWCRTSRRCSTTTRCSSASTPTCGGRPAPRTARRVALETADWMLRDLRTAEGGFASALDADTDGVEGLTYVWTPDAARRGARPRRRRVGRRPARRDAGRGPSSTGPRRCSCRATRTTEARWAAARERLARGPRRAAPAGPRRQGRHRVERPRRRRARRGRRAAGPARPGRRRDAAPPTCSPTSTSSTAGCAGSPATARPVRTPACWRTTPTSPRACSRSTP